MAVDNERDSLWMIDLCSSCKSNPVIRRMTRAERAARDDWGREPNWYRNNATAMVGRFSRRANRLNPMNIFDVFKRKWLD